MELWLDNHRTVVDSYRTALVASYRTVVGSYKTVFVSNKRMIEKF